MFFFEGDRYENANGMKEYFEQFDGFLESIVCLKYAIFLSFYFCHFSLYQECLVSYPIRNDNI